MNYYIFIILAVLVFIVQRTISLLKTHISQSEEDNRQIKAQLIQIYKKLAEVQQPIVIEKQVIVESQPVQETKIEVEPAQQIIQSVPAEEEIKEETVDQAEEPVVEAITTEEVEAPRLIRINNVTETKVETNADPTEPTIGNLFDKFKKGDIDYEKYIGENLISKIGIAILVLAIAFFVKYAIDNDWIGPVGRVCIGLLCGGILVGLAHRLRKDYAAFTSVLVGGGLAIFYFTIALAYHQYHLFDQTVSFGIMIVITIFAVVLSLLYDRQELAVISMVGGYATPFMVSNGSGNYIALFTYLCLLNTGMLVIAYMRIWRILNVLGFIFTFLIFDSWLFTLDYLTPVGTYTNGFIFATVFFIFFFSAAIANNIKENKKFLPFDFGMLLTNSIQYFAFGLYLLSEMKCMEYKGLFSSCMAAFHLAASLLLFRRQTADKNILYLLIGITLTFISITAPLQLEGSFITLFWASESVVLLWLYQKSQIRIISLSATIVWCITIISMALLLGQNYGESYSHVQLSIIANKGFVSAIYVSICTAILYFLLGKRSEETEIPKNYLLPRYVFLVAAILIGFIAGALEIVYQFDSRFEISLSSMYFMLYLLIFVVSVMSIIKKYELVNLSYVTQAIILAAVIAAYMIHLPMLFDTFHTMLEGHKYIPYFTAHWISAAIVALLIAKLIDLLRKAEHLQQIYTILTWAVSTLIIIFLSAEFYFAVFGIFYTPKSELSLDNVFIKACLPILWGLCSFGFMWVGMKERFRTLRILSLVLFAVTLLKLFAFDISDVPVAGKIAAFFCLGVMLLVVSFMYQRLKKLIIQDEENK